MGDHVWKVCPSCGWSTRKRRTTKCQQCGDDLKVLERKSNPKKLARKKVIKRFKFPKKKKQKWMEGEIW